MSVPTNDKASGDGLPPKRVWGVKAELQFRRLLADAMKGSGRNRAQLAKELSVILGCFETWEKVRNTLNDCVRSRKNGRMVRFPAAWIPAMCAVIGSDQLQRHLLSDRLRSLLAIGESVAQSAESLQTAQEQIARLTGKISDGK